MLNERQEQILLSLKNFDYLTVNQIHKLHDLKSKRNAYRVIRQIEPYTNVFKDDGRNVYYLNKKGREYVDCSKKRTKLTSANHYLMRNDLYIHLNCPRTWKNEIRMKYQSSKNKIILIADAHYQTNKHHLIEIDNTQKMQKNKIKIEKYRRLIEKGVFKGFPELIWVTTSKYRQQALMELCDGLDVQVFLNTDIGG